jgi:AcrR family transcriptional regulator
VTQPTAVRSRSRDPERTRAAILSAARAEFVEHGFTGARTSAIAKTAGVPQGLIYHYFENKQELFDAVMEEVFAPYFGGMMEMLSGAESANLDLLEKSVRLYFHFLQENPHVPRLLAWWMADQGWKDKPLVRKRELGTQVEELGAKRIAEGQAAGHIRPELDPGFVIKTFIDLCLMWHMSKGSHLLECGLDDGCEDRDLDYLEHAVEVFMRGIVVPPASS